MDSAKKSLITSVKDITVVIKLELNEIKDDEVRACIDVLCSSLTLFPISSSIHFYFYFSLIAVGVFFFVSFYDDMEKECVHLNKQ